MSLWIYILYVFIIFFAIFVVVSYNPIHSLLFLILVFFSVGCLFILLGIDFLGLSFFLVYAGAIAILFLFVFMMLDLTKTYEDNGNMTEKYKNKILFFFSLFLFFISSLIFFNKSFFSYYFLLLMTERMFFFNLIDKTYLIHVYLFDKYFILFFFIGFLLLISMCGVIFILRNIRNNK